MAREPVKKQPPDFVKDPTNQASILLMVGSTLWRILSAWANIDFLLSIKKGGIAMILQFLQSTGWWLIVLVGIIVLLYKGFWGTTKPNHSPTWYLLISCSIIAFLFGAFLAIQPFSAMPNVIISWGQYSKGCRAIIVTSALVSFKKDYKIGFACGVSDPTIDPVHDKRITLSNPFEITGGTIEIHAPYNPETAAILANAEPGTEFNMWFRVILIPNKIPKEKITTLSDLKTFGGKIVGEEDLR